MCKNQELTNLIKKIKYQSGLRQSDIASQIGVSGSYLSDALNGRVPFSDSLRKKIYEQFPYLLTGEGEMLKPTEGVAPRDTIPLEDVSRQGNTDNTLDRLLTMMERLIEQGDRQTRVAEINAEANKQNSDNLARLIERWDAMQRNSLSHRQGVG